VADGKAGAPEGNTNSSRDNRLWRNTIQRAIAQGNGERLRAIAEKLLDKAAEGDMAAIKELGDRLDGKASQQVMLSGSVGVHQLTDDELDRAIAKAASEAGTAVAFAGEGETQPDA
jgi:hypothetical protein